MSKSGKNTGALHEMEGITPPSSLSDKVANKVKERRKKTLSNEELLKGLLSGDKSALSRAITLVESTKTTHRKQAAQLLESCLPHANNSLRIGITGVPGVGKSTFIESFGKLYTGQGHNVAVLAVDPSSRLSRGSILGDKTRMEELVKDKNAFIRPSASGTSLGGVARKTREAIILCEAAGYNIIIIETVGVGQSETVVHSMTDFFLLLKLAGAGDELQGIKRGIMEMADAIVINKADGENVKAAKLAKTEFNRALHLFPEKESGWSPKTLTCSALQNEGIHEIGELIERYVEKTKANGFFQRRRNEQNEFWLLQTIENALKNEFYEDPRIKAELKKQLEALGDNKTTPFEAANYLLGLYKKHQ
ncbi:methylmalonyl Co-A mutase-associated GTPase MeaB [Pukyongia salina]|nr:methylmalonyl Co-A mutase-associated GTPase MeaB [Pukyongia salina]